MPDRVNPKRSYVSPRRQDQATATRREIMRAAQRLFEADGYPATTMATIAASAGVALKTVYLAYATKSGLLRALWDVLLRGEEDVPVAQLEWYQRTLAEADPVEQVKQIAHNSRVVKERIGPLLKVIRDAAPADPEVAVLWQLIQTDFHRNQLVLVESLQKKKALKPGLSAAKATDILWTLNHPDVWHLFVSRGWTPEQFERWFADAVRTQLLKRD